jgi:hypothetical protein
VKGRKARGKARLACVLAMAWCGAASSLGAQDVTEEATRITASQEEAAKHFERRIAPLLSRHCLECHGSTSKKGRLDLSRREAALEGGKSGTAVVPGKAAESLLWQYIENDSMPKNRPPLAAHEKRLLWLWIEGGAVWSGDAIGQPAGAATGRGGDVLRRLTLAEYIETVRSTTGVELEEEARRILPQDLRADGFSNTAYNLGVDLGHVEGYARLAEIIASRIDPLALAAEHAPCRESTETCLRQVIAGLGKWFLRGPLDEAEIAAFLGVSTAVLTEGGDFAEAVRYVVEALLQSPRFLYRIENQQGDGAARPAGAHELASRLSYILWGGPPDRELMRAAGAGELADRDGAGAQVRRMLEDPRAVKRSSRFLQEWMDLDRLDHLRPHPERFPLWDPQLAADMRNETLAFFEHLAWEEKRPLWELMNAQVTFATPRLAQHYDLAAQHYDLAAQHYDLAAQHDGLDARRVTVAPATPGAAGVPRRVVGGLQALYTFAEGSGETVRDVSGAGEPLHLRISSPHAVRWSDAGLEVTSQALIAADAPPARLTEAIRSSGAVTLEAWVTPAAGTQTGPARIVTLSGGISERNFTLGQSGDGFMTRLRTTATSANGEPALESRPGTAGARQVHVVYSRDASGTAVIYIDGRESRRLEIGGDLSRWDGKFRLALANELSKDRAWLGTFHLVAVFDRALAPEEVERNHAAGPRGHGAPSPAPVHRREWREDGLQALYAFEEGGGTLRDGSQAGEPLDLEVEDAAAVQWNRGRLGVEAPVLISSRSPPARLIDAIKRSKAFSVEAWITPAGSGQKGPARIITLSSGPSQRNFTLGQEGDSFEVRVRARGTDSNGLPALRSPSGAVETRMTHIIFTRDAAGRAKLYLDGEEKAASDGGELADWDSGFRLALANETTKDRPWRGAFHRVAIYSRALAAEEARARSGRMERYDLSAAPGRGGLLTQGSVLTVGGDEASMVTRGLFILRELLYSGVDDPPPCVDTTPVPARPGMSQRAIAEQRISDSSCRGCHSIFEPLAFGLEKHDGLGAYHEIDEHGNVLRDDGEILFPGEERPVPYKSCAELMDLLAASDRVRRGLTRKVTQFALGRPLVEEDEPLLEAIHAEALAGGGTYASLIAAIVLSDLVLKTRTETNQ